MVPAAPTGGHAHSRLLRGCAAPGGRARQGDLAPLWHKVHCGVSTVSRRGAAHRRAELQYHAGRASLAGRARDAAGAGRANIRQCARPEASGRGAARKRGAPESGGDVRRGGVLDGGGEYRACLGHRDASETVRVRAGCRAHARELLPDCAPRGPRAAARGGRTGHAVGSRCSWAPC